MKKTLFAMFVLFIASAFIFESNAQESKQEKKEDKKVEMKEAVDGKAFNTICPVSGEEVDANITYSYEGKTYALCCNSCLKKFKKDPAKYSSRLSEDGNSLKKKNKSKDSE